LCQYRFRCFEAEGKRIKEEDKKESEKALVAVSLGSNRSVRVLGPSAVFLGVDLGGWGKKNLSKKDTTY